MAEILERVAREGTLTALDKEFLVTEEKENFPQMLRMLAQRGTVHEDVIHEDKKQAMQARAQDAIHDTLKCGRRIAQSEGHVTELVVPLMCFECRLFLSWKDTDLVISSPQIQFGEDFCSGQFIKKFVNYWHGKDNLHCEIIEMTVVDAKPP